MKYLFLLFATVLSLSAHAQSVFFQSFPITNQSGAAFSIESWYYAEREPNSNSGIALMVLSYDDAGKQVGTQLGELTMKDFKPGEWNKITLSGKINKKAKKLVIGALYSGPAKIAFDDLVMTVKGQQDTVLKNTDFESPDLQPWTFNNTAKGVTISVSNERAHSGKQSLLIDASAVVDNTYGRNKDAGHYANINGNKIYYETYGEGAPLLLLHGGLNSIRNYSQQIPELSRHYKVIAVDTRGHGNSTVDTTTLTYELYADDMNKLLDTLHLDHVNILGWSDGGNTGLILAMQHPEKVKKLAIMGANLYNDQTSVVEWVNDTCRAEIKRAAPGSMEQRVNQCLLTQPHIQPAALHAIQCPVLVMAGEHDVIKEQHTKLIAASIPNSSLHIFKKGTHFAPSEMPDVFNKTVLEFFSK